MNLYLLDWQETKHGKQPTPSQVYHWLKSQGFTPDGMPKVYPNGTVHIELAGSGASHEGLIEEVWASFEPVAEVSQADSLALLVEDFLRVRTELLAMPEHKRSLAERGLLATMALVMHGYGIPTE